MTDQREDVDDILQHYGVLGMKWGVRKDDRKPLMTREQKKAAARLAGMAAGTLAVAAGVTYVGYSLVKSGTVNMNTVNRIINHPATRRAANKATNLAVAKVVADNIISEPTTVAHYARGKDVGFKVVKSGGSPSPIEELESANIPEDGNEVFKKFGKNSEKIAVKFFDPDGRKDKAGRPIHHEVVVPSTMTSGINNIDDVKTKLWPLLKDDYDKIYNQVRVPLDGTRESAKITYKPTDD